MKIKHIICGLLAVVLPLGCAVSVSAAKRIQHTDTSLIGDVDNNGTIEIFDATLLQKHLVEYDTGLDPNDYKTIKALDTNNDNTVTYIPQKLSLSQTKKPMMNKSLLLIKKQ